MNSVQAITAGVSLLALLSSLCLWIVQRRKQRACLQPWWGGDPLRLTGARSVEAPDTVSATFETTLVIVNASTLPDALIDLHCRVLSLDGRWLPLVLLKEGNHRENYPGLPLELPPRQGVGHLVGFGVEVPREKMDHLAQVLKTPMQIQVEMIGLGERAHRGEILVEGLPH